MVIQTQNDSLIEVINLILILIQNIFDCFKHLIRMIPEFRKCALINLDRIAKRLSSFVPLIREKAYEHKLQLILNDLHLVRSDLQLILSKNYHLEMKVKDQKQQLRQLTQIIQKTKEDYQLQIRMMRIKQQKSIEELNFIKFVRGGEINSQSKKMAMKSQNIEHQEKKGLNHDHKHLLIQENLSLKPLRMQATAKRQPSHINHKDSPQTIPFKPQAHISLQFSISEFSPYKKQQTDFLTEQVWKRSINRDQKISMSQDNEKGLKEKKKKAKSGLIKKEPQEKDNPSLGHRKKKSEQLAFLVDQQFKIPQIKERYFSTDLQ